MDEAPGGGRTVRDARFRYVRHFLPWVGGDDLPTYADGVPITAELRAARKAGTLPSNARWFSRATRPAEELFDVAADPDELVDLAATPAHAGDLARLRGELRAWMRETKDTGILPEPILRREARVAGSEWAIFHPPVGDAADRYDVILETAWAVADGRDAAEVRSGLRSSDPAVRFWAVAGTGWAAQRGNADTAALAPLLEDPEPTVRIAAATWLLRCAAAASADRSLAVLATEMATDDPDVRLAALVAIDGLGAATRSLWPAAAALDLGTDEDYSRRTAQRIRRGLAADPSPISDP